MFADMVGYTALMQEDEARTKALRDRHRKALEDCVRSHGGEIVQYYGDGTLTIFPSAVEAVECAVKIQLEMQQEPKVPLRIGIHTGDIVQDAEGVYGSGVNIAARVQAMGRPGSVMISGKVGDELRSHPELKVRRYGRYRLKNVGHAVTVFALSVPGLVVPSKDELATTGALSVEWGIRLGKTLSAVMTPPVRLATAGIVFTVVAYVFLSGLLGMGSEDIIGLAMLPIEIQGPESMEMQSFAHGITADITSSLRSLLGLRVFGGPTTAGYKGKPTTASEVGKELNAQVVLTVELMQDLEGPSLSVYLIDARNNALLGDWHYQLNDEETPTMQFQENLVREIVQVLNLPASDGPLTRPHTTIRAAWKAYSTGRYHLEDRTPESIFQAISFFGEATWIDPTYALAKSGLADAYHLLVGYNVLSPEQGMERSLAAAREAVELDSTLGEAWTSLGGIQHVYEWNWDAAEASFHRAIELAPSYAQAYTWRVLLRISQGDLEGAERDQLKALELDPLNPGFNAWLGRVIYFQRDYDRALVQLRQTMEEYPQFLWTYGFTGLCYAAADSLQQAIGIFSQAVDVVEQTGQREPALLAGLGYSLGMAGQTRAARQILRELETLASQQYVSPYYLAGVHIGLGEHESAFARLDEACQHRSEWLVYMKADPILDPLRGDPRFHEIVRKVGLPD